MSNQEKFYVVVVKERKSTRFHFFNDLATACCADRHEKGTKHLTFTRSQLEEILNPEETNQERMDRILPTLYTEEELNSPEPNEYPEEVESNA